MKVKILVIVVIFIISFATLYESSGNNQGEIPVLMYHHLEDNMNNNSTIDPVNFENQIKTLKEEGYNAITIQQFYNYINGVDKLPEKPVLITFDDGYLSNYEKAYPILRKYDMNATIFIIASRILEKNEKNVYSNEIPKMNWEQLREMKDYISIQSHTWDLHYKLKGNFGRMKGAIYAPSYIDGKLESKEEYEERVKNDFYLSKEIIKEKLGYEPIALSYPFGDYSGNTMKLAQEAGFKMAFGINNKRIKIGDDLYSLKRITVNGNLTGEELIDEIENKFFWERTNK